MAAEQNPSVTESQFYLPADTFFLRHADIGLTYDDVTLATLYSNTLPRDTVLDTSLAGDWSCTYPLSPPTWIPSPNTAWPLPWRLTAASVSFITT